MELDLEAVVHRLKEDLSLTEEISGDAAAADADTRDGIRKRTTRIRREAKDDEFVVYY